MKQIYLDGFIGKDAEVGTTRNGRKYVRFSLGNKSFSNGENKTEWFDITSYDQRVIENRVKYLTKGRFASIVGDFNVTYSIKDGKVYINQYVTANTIETPVFGNRSDESQQQATESVSTYSQKPKPASEPVAVSVAASNSDDIDLPF